MQLRHGTMRSVILIGRYAVKMPCIRWRWAWYGRVKGLLANIEEGNIYRAWKAYPFHTGCDLCPVVWQSWGGFISVMLRAEPYPHVDVLPDHHCNIHTDIKPENYGILNGKVVCIDYAQPLPSP